MSRVRIGTGSIPTLAKFSPKRRFKPGARCWINAAFNCAPLTMSGTIENRSWISQFGRWLVELVLVLVGVYAAFCLNKYEQATEPPKRRDQILAYRDQRLEDGISSANTDPATEEKL